MYRKRRPWPPLRFNGLLPQLLTFLDRPLLEGPAISDGYHSKQSAYPDAGTRCSFHRRGAANGETRADLIYT